MTAPARCGKLARLVDGDWFNGAIVAIIIANAVVLGLETYPKVMAAYGSTLVWLNAAFYVIFLAELVLRFVSYGRRPADFFRSGWNVFDLVVIGAVLIPGIREQAQVLRLLRLARVVRLARFLPDARILVLTVVKSVPSMFSVVVIIALLLFVYGMIGWALFGAELPGNWGTIGRSMLTLFVLLTLENFPVYLAEAEPVSPFAIPFFLSYVLLAAFLVLNLLIGIVISSMEEARAHHADEIANRDRSGVSGPPEWTANGELLERIDELRVALGALEGELQGLRPTFGAGADGSEDPMDFQDPSSSTRDRG